ncbi:hypothetical protein B5X24_HaOG215559 [Helicoverpa armigera]|nr:hypothetical protein B5X24_HaOG215559 [Helicoverpa armigera]
MEKEMEEFWRTMKLEMAAQTREITEAVTKNVTENTDNGKLHLTTKTYIPKETSKTHTPRRLVTAGYCDHYPPNTTSLPLSNKFVNKTQPNAKTLHIATYNTLSLRTEESLQELLYSLESIKWDIIGLSEVRRNGEAIEERSQVILYYKGEIPGRSGVGFIIKKERKKFIVEIIGISDRIAILNIKIPPGNEVWSIVQIYSPTEQSTTSEIDFFYTSLNNALKDHTHKNCIVMGDFNARVGEPRNGEDAVLGPYSSGKRTRNGQKLIEMAFENNMKIMNSVFKKRHSRRWTWVSPDGRYRNEIDYFLTNRPKSIDDCGTIANQNFNSNHRMVRARLNISASLRLNRPFKINSPIPNNRTRTIITKEKLKSMTESSLQHLNTQQKYNIIHEILTAESEISSKGKEQVNKYISEKAKELLENRSKLIRMANKTKDIRKQIGKISNEIKSQMRKDREQLRLKTFENHIRRTGGIKKALKCLSDKTTWIPKVKERHKTMTKRSDILSTATRFYKTLYSSKNQINKTDLDSKDKVPPILEDEIIKAIETQKKNKAPGPDGINNELLSDCKSAIAPLLKYVFNDVVDTEKIPTQWTTSTIILLHKKGDRDEINNYRPISLMSNIYKIFAKVILWRITRTLDENQPKEQAGFRAGYSTLDHVHTVRQIFQKTKEFNMPFYCCFIDFNKAFDSIEHENIWSCLKIQGVEHKYIRIIKNVYTNSTAKIRLEKEGKEIKIYRGVRQGDPLSPKLFTAVLEGVFRKLDWNQYGLNINGELLSHLRFADDIILFAKTKDHLQSMLKDLETESNKVGLTMNVTKTKAMTNASEEEIIINGKSIEFVKEYTYLGQQISVTDMMSKEIDTRIAQAWKCYWGFKDIMKNTEIKMNIKAKLYNTCVLPVLTYGCQTWALTKEQNNKLRTCQTAMERSMLNIKKSDRIRNTKIRKRTKIEDVTIRIKKLKWKWTGHIIRGIEKWTNIVTFWYPRNCKRNRGRQFLRWEDEIKMVAGKTWTRTALNRTKWKEMEEAFAKIGQTDQVVGVTDSQESIG